MDGPILTQSDREAAMNAWEQTASEGGIWADCVASVFRAGIERAEIAPPLDEAVSELMNIANAKRVKNFRDDTEFADWAQSRAWYALQNLTDAHAAAAEPAISAPPPNFLAHGLGVSHFPPAAEIAPAVPRLCAIAAKYIACYVQQVNVIGGIHEADADRAYVSHCEDAWAKSAAPEPPDASFVELCNTVIQPQIAPAAPAVALPEGMSGPYRERRTMAELSDNLVECAARANDSDAHTILVAAGIVQANGERSRQAAPDAEVAALIDAIGDYHQGDEDGIFVTVSREACDKAAAALQSQQQRIAELEQRYELLSARQYDSDCSIAKRIKAEADANRHFDRATKAEAELAAARKVIEAADEIDRAIESAASDTLYMLAQRYRTTRAALDAWAKSAAPKAGTEPKYCDGCPTPIRCSNKQHCLSECVHEWETRHHENTANWNVCRKCGAET